MSDYMDKLIHVGYTNKYQLDYAKDQEGSFYCDHDNECNIPLYMLTAHSFRAHNNVVVETHDAMQARIVELVFSLDDRDCYIADADMKNAELTARKAELEAMSAEVISMLSSGKYKHDCSKIVGVIIKALKDNS